jgi:S-adenosylmethionine:tRNA ribosyltransferase-isomerase
VLDDRLDLRDARLLAALEPVEPRVDAAPARADEVDEEREIVDAGVTLGEELAFEPLESPDRLVEQAAYLGDVPGDGQYFGPHAVAYGSSHLGGDRGLELGGGGGERLDLSARALERSLHQGGVGAASGGLGDPLLRTFQSQFVHGRRGYSHRRMDTALLEYDLPEELIAQRPLARRDASRLLVYRRESRDVEHRTFGDLPALLAGELVVVNDTRVVPARLRLRRATGGQVEVLLLERVAANGMWEALARPARRLRAGEQLGPVELLEPLGDGRWLVRLEGEPDGEMPLPPYIHERLDDPERYQTVYASAAAAGSAAAPTAGLHFTPELLAQLDPVRVTLHVGLDTFRPVASDVLEEHALHGERYEIGSDAWARIARAKRVLAVGTTTVRALEAATATGELSGRTSLFIAPGYAFRRVDALLTNFHLPRSTLLALVMAFAGVEETRELYTLAVQERYRFYSFGDAMLVL